MNEFSVDLDEMRRACDQLAVAARQLAAHPDSREPLLPDDMGIAELARVLNEFRGASNRAVRVLSGDITEVETRLDQNARAYQTTDDEGAGAFNAILSSLD